MPYTYTELRKAVRSMLQNIGPTTLTDEKLDVLLTQGKRQLDRDKPKVVSADLTGTGKKFYQLTTTLPEWVNQFSTIQFIENPKAIIANDDEIKYEDPRNFRVIEQDDVEYLRIETGISSGKLAHVRFTTPWKVSGLEGETTTTITDRLKNALEFVCAATVCYSLSAKSAGQLDEQVEADLINWGGKQASYKFVAKDFEDRYYLELGMDKNKVRPVMLRMDYDQDPKRITPLTHYRHG